MTQAINEQPALLPPVDVCEDSGGITLYADLPGVPKDKLDVHVDGDTLIIEGEMALEMPRGLEATHVEVGLARYRRVFALSKELDAGESVRSRTSIARFVSRNISQPTQTSTNIPATRSGASTIVRVGLAAIASPPKARLTTRLRTSSSP